MKLIALFSVRNEYDQPPNNLVCVWDKRPTIETLSEALEMEFPNTDDETTLSIAKLWSYIEVTIGDCSYRIQEIETGKVL